MIRWRLIFVGFLFFLGFGLVIFRAFNLQMMPHDKVEDLARRQLTQTIEIVGRRGAIKDRNGRELAISLNSQSLFANPKLIKNPDEMARKLAPILGQSREAIADKIKAASQRHFVWIARQLKPEVLARLEQLNLKKLPGVGLLPEFRREYPFGELAGQTVGFVSIDGQGLEGLEEALDSSLRGDRNTHRVHRDALGRPIFSHRDQINLDLSGGADIESSLDLRLQHVAEKAVVEAVGHHNADGGVAIVMDPYTGELLAMANAPTFNPNNSATSAPQVKRNRALSDPYEPGSVVKPFVVAKAIEDKIVKIDSVIKTHGGQIRVGRKTIGEAEASHRFEKLSIVDLIRVSSNVGMVVLKDLMGFDRINRVLRDLGFGSRSGIEVHGESRGIYNTPSSKQQLEQATISFGQGIAATPLQVATAFAALANGGFRVTPTLLKGKGVAERDDQKRVFSLSTVSTMRLILEKVVQGEGTGTAARIEGLTVAGKTGTSQKVDFKNGGYEKEAYWSSFAGFLPSQNPRFVILVMIDHPRSNGYYGGVVAAPVFAKIAREAIRMTGSIDQKYEQKKARPRALQPVTALPVVARRQSGQVDDLNQSPNLVGLPLTLAMRLLKSRNLKMSLQGQGAWVDDQIPKAGQPLQSDSTIYLKLR